MKLWYNQSLVESQDAPFENGWMSGNGIFETIRTIEGIPLALSRHVRRAIKGGKTTGKKGRENRRKRWAERGKKEGGASGEKSKKRGGR